MRTTFTLALATALLLAPASTVLAQGTKPPAKPVAAQPAVDDTPSTAAQKKACDVKWNQEKAKTGVKGYKAYFTFMANCLP